MTQRSYNNPRNTTDGPKGQTRRSASSAKPKRAAAGSVYVAKPNAKEKRKQEEAKQQERAARSAANDAAAMAKVQTMIDEYGKWRRIWIILVVIAIVAIVLSWGLSYLMGEGQLLAQFGEQRNLAMGVPMVVGYATIIAALVVDFRHLRPLRKAQTAAYRQEKASKKAQKHAEEAAREQEAAKKPRFWQRKKG